MTARDVAICWKRDSGLGRARGGIGKGYAVDRVWELLATALLAPSYRAAAREGRAKT